MHPLLDDFGILNRLLFDQKVGHEEDLFRLLGLVHLFSASGIHIYSLLHSLRRFLEWGARLLGHRGLTAQRAYFWVGLVLLFYLWSLQDYRIGFARPILIFLMRSWTLQKGIRWQVLYPLLLCFIFDVLFCNTVGKPHYYLAVGGGLWALQQVQKKGAWLEHLAMAVGSWIFTAPLDLMSDHLVSWMTPIWSLITLPLISVVLYPLTLLNWILFHSISPAVLWLWNQMMKGVLWVLDRGFTFSVVGDRGIAYGGALSLVMTFFLVSDRKNKIKITSVGLVLVSLFWLRCMSFLPEASAQVVQVDVKQGDSLLIHSEHRNEMMDVGGARALTPNQWIRKLSRYGVTSVDTILLSHLDEDHVGGLHSLLPYVMVGKIQTAREHWKSKKGKHLEVWIRNHFPKTEICFDHCFQSGRVKWFRSQDHQHSHGNEWMAGVSIPVNERTLYLAVGDADQDQEKQFLSEFLNEIQAYPERLWKVSHHGSRFASSSEVLQILQPKECWISVGKHNPYHHPAREALERLHQIRTQIHRTDEEGDIAFRVENTIQPYFWSTIGK